MMKRLFFGILLMVLFWNVQMDAARHSCFPQKIQFFRKTKFFQSGSKIKKDGFFAIKIMEAAHSRKILRLGTKNKKKCMVLQKEELSIIGHLRKKIYKLSFKINNILGKKCIIDWHSTVEYGQGCEISSARLTSAVLI